MHVTCKTIIFYSKSWIFIIYHQQTFILNSDSDSITFAPILWLAILFYLLFTIMKFYFALWKSFYSSEDLSLLYELRWSKWNSFFRDHLFLEIFYHSFLILIVFLIDAYLILTLSQGFRCNDHSHSFRNVIEPFHECFLFRSSSN